MATRIRYEKDRASGHLKTASSFHSNVSGVKYRASFDPQLFHYYIQNDQGVVLLKGNARSLHDAKIAIKSELRRLGVEFRDEKRERD